MTPAAPPADPPRPLIVRLRNWVGDVLLSLPTLTRLAEAGHALQLVGKGWAADLLAGHGWPVHGLPKTSSERVALLRGLRAEARLADPGFGRRLNAVAFPYSFSSALEMRLAGLRALGHANEGRSLLLARSIPRARDRHELRVMWALGDALLGTPAEPPPSLGLRLAPRHREEAAALRARHGLADGFVVICPFAGGTWSHGPKTWPGFPRLVAQALPALGRRIVVCPGPGEEAASRAHFPGALQLPGVGLGAYAALLSQAALMVANDTGPGHLAAAVGCPLVSVMGPSEPARWRPWGPAVEVVQGPDATWPDEAAVVAAAKGALDGRGSPG